MAELSPGFLAAGLAHTPVRPAEAIAAGRLTAVLAISGKPVFQFLYPRLKGLNLGLQGSDLLSLLGNDGQEALHQGNNGLGAKVVGGSDPFDAHGYAIRTPAVTRLSGDPERLSRQTPAGWPGFLAPCHPSVHYHYSCQAS